MDDKPELSAIEGFYFNAFNFMFPMRGSGMGITAIHISAYSEYYSIYGAPHSLGIFSQIIRNIDGLYMQDEYKNTQKKA